MASVVAPNSTSKLEFDVNLTCSSCEVKVRQSLEDIGVRKVDIDVEKQTVVVDTHIPVAKVTEAIQSTGKKAVLKGYGSSEGLGANLPSAVSEVFGPPGIIGVVRFSQISDDICVIDGTIDGLSSGAHWLHIHEFGDISKGCQSTGDVYEPRGRCTSPGLHRRYGSLGEIQADENGRSIFRKSDDTVKVGDIIGRSLVVCLAKHSTNGRPAGSNFSSLACGIIARASGIYQNPKRICACDGVTVWDEKNAPAKSL